MVAVEATVVLCEGPSRIDDIVLESVVGNDSVPEVVTLVKVCVVGVVISKLVDVLERMVDNGWLVEDTRDDVADVEMSMFSFVYDVTDGDIGDVWRPDETVRAEGDDDVPMLDDVDDEAVVKVPVPSTYDWTMEDFTDDEPVLEDVIDVTGVEVDPVS